MLPRLLDANLNEITRLHPDKLSVKRNLVPLSTATMSLPEGEPTVSLRQWVELYRKNISLGLYRVSSVKTDYGDGQNISLEHGIATLGDYLTAADTTLTGTPYSIMGTLLGYQTRWQRGTIPNVGSYTVKVDRSNVLSAVLDLLKQMNGYMLTYNFTTWSVGIVAMETTPSCEARMRRNTESVRITIDDNDLCTRVYAVGLTNGYMDADTIGTWGVIAKSLGTDDNAPAAEVQAYAAQFFAEYKNPRVNIEISAREFSEKTGESIDAFDTGKLCRTALPDWNYTVDERIVAANYPDVLGDPDDVQLSLSTTPRDLSRTLAGINADLYGTSTAQSSGGGGGGSSGKGKLQEYHTAILRNTDSVQILAWDVDDLNEDMITAQASITVNADNIELKVSKNGVISSINQTSESITINASRINLIGYVTASQLTATIAAIDAMYLDYMSAVTGVVHDLYATSTFRLQGETINRASTVVGVGLNVSKDTIHYDYGGASYSVSVVTNVSLDTDTILYLAH